MIKSFQLTKERKYILIVGAALLIVGIMYRFFPAVYGFFSASEEIEFKRETIAKYQRVVSEGQWIEKKKTRLSRELRKMEDRLLTGKGYSLAAVEIQGIINDIAQSNNVKVQTMQVLNPEETENLGYVAIPVRFSINSNILQLKEFIYKIESPDKMLIIKGLSAEVSSRGDADEIRATMTVEGVMKAKPKVDKPT